MPFKLTKSIKKLIAFWQILNRWDQILAIFLIIGWTFTIIIYFLPSRYPFEGNILAKGMSFTYTGESDKLFLNNLEQLRALDIQGRQDQVITLTGKIENVNDPEVNKKINQLNLENLPKTNKKNNQSNLDNLKIELLYPTSHLIFKNDITLSELRINSETRINQLAYYPQNNYLSLCLQSLALDTSSECISPESLDGSNKINLGNFKIKLGQQPIQVILTGYNLPELGITKGPDDSTALEFTFTPDNDEYNLMLISPTKLYIDLPDLESDVDSSGWIGQELNVKDVSFTDLPRTAKVTDELELSTILEGELRIAKQEIKLQERQFLNFDGELGINKIAYLEIQKAKKDNKTEEQPGLKVFVIGESEKITAGLSKNFPVQSLNPKLSSKLPQEAINTFLAFLGATTAVFLERLFSRNL